MITPVCSALSPSASSSTAAAAPVATPQNTTSHRRGCSSPPEESIPITIEAESAPVTKKMATRNTASVAVTTDSGNSCRVPKSAFSSPPSRTVAMSTPPLRCRSKAAPPRIENQTKLTRLGMAMTKRTNWRMVRPLEIRAMNIPTNGVHDIHQAQ